MEDLENKLDQDFVFYLGFVSSFMRRLRDKDTIYHCEQWLQKLCGEPCKGIEMKRCRNIYLSQLIMAMQIGVLGPEFNVNLDEVDITRANEVFKLGDPTMEPPAWLTDSDFAPQGETPSKRGRTYVATRTLPDGQGAFAYIALSLADEEPMWLGGGEGVFDKKMERTYKEQAPEFELEKILSRRKDPQERQRVVAFYDILLDNIADELNGKIEPYQNLTVNGLLEQLEEDLRDRDMFAPLEHLDEESLRLELLAILHERITARVDKVNERQELLDEIEKSVTGAAFAEPMVDPENQLPAVMWEQAISKAPNKKHIDKLQEMYPVSLIEKFVELLADYKEEIAVKIQRRYDNIIAQMKRELRVEDDKGKRIAEEAQAACDQAILVMKHVEEYFKKKLDAENAIKMKQEAPKSEHEKIYEHMKSAIMEQQKCVEEEAARGKALAHQINIVTQQADVAAKINQEVMRKIEEANTTTRKTITRLNTCIMHHKERLGSIEIVQTHKMD